MDAKLERISLMIRKDQHEEIVQQELNLSGLVRDLLDDYLSANSITLSLSEETMSLYNQIVSNTGAGDNEIEPYLRKALALMLKDRIGVMEKLSKKLEKEQL